jgi:hypothetical protein
VTPYLLGLVTLPVLAATLFALGWCWRWIRDNEWITNIITGRLLPHQLYRRAHFGIRITACKRVWCVDLPGKIGILVTAGYDRIEPELYDQAARAVCGVLAPETEARVPHRRKARDLGINFDNEEI